MIARHSGIIVGLERDLRIGLVAKALDMPSSYGWGAVAQVPIHCFPLESGTIPNKDKGQGITA